MKSAIKDAFRNIKTACKKKLEEIYPKGLPEDIRSRCDQELLFLEHSDYVDDFEIFRRLSGETKKSSNAISVRGTLSGSILYFLLGNNCYNPLPPHYYCTECGYYEPVKTRLFGIDLPQKKCPHCNSTVTADGYNLPLESVWGNTGRKIISFEYNVNSEFLPFARRVLRTAYPDSEIVPWGMFQLDTGSGSIHPDNRIIGIRLTGYAILPPGNTIQDYPDLISYLENGDACVTGSSWEMEEHMIKVIRLFTSEYLDELVRLQRSTGIYFSELGTKELREITWSSIYNTSIPNNKSRILFREYRPKSFKDMVALDSCSHNSFVWQEGDNSRIDPGKFRKMISGECFKKYPCFTREDFFDCMVECKTERSLAFDASERIGKGHANSNGKYRQQFFDLPIPSEMKDIAGNYLYVFPRAHCIEYILMYARLAYYAKADSRAFGRIVFRKK